MHIIKKLTIATLGTAWLTLSTGIAPVKAALLEFKFTVKDVFTYPGYEDQNGFFVLNTQTREIVDSGGELNPPNGIFLRTEFTVDTMGGDSFLTIKNFKCRQLFNIPNGLQVCFGTDNFARAVNLQFKGEDLFNQLSSNPSDYQDSFVVGINPEPLPDPDTGYIPSFFNIIGSNFQYISYIALSPYPVSALQVRNIETTQVIPESTNTTAILTIGALGFGLVLKRKHKTLLK